MDLTNSITGITVAGLAATTISVGLRLWTRYRMRSLGYDDAAYCVTYIVFAVYCGMTLIVVRTGFGVVPETTLDLKKQGAKFLFLAELAYIATAALIRLSVALMLFRINVRPLYRRVIVAIVLLCQVIAVTMIGLLLANCRPVPFSWGEGEGRCVAVKTIKLVSVAFSLIDIMTNWILSLLPVGFLWNVQMRCRAKAGLVGLLGLGLLSSISTVVRLKYQVQAPKHDLTGKTLPKQLNNLQLSLWSHIEIFLALLAGALVAARPLLRQALDLLAASLGFAAGNRGTPTAEKTSPSPTVVDAAGASSKGRDSDLRLSLGWTPPATHPDAAYLGDLSSCPSPSFSSLSSHTSSKATRNTRTHTPLGSNSEAGGSAERIWRLTSGGGGDADSEDQGGGSHCGVSVPQGRGS